MTLLFVLGLVWCCGLVSSPARANELTPAPLSLVVNGEERDLATVLLARDDVLVLRRDLEAAGLEDVPAAADRMVGNERYVSLASLAPRLGYRVDEEALTLGVDAPPEYFGTTTVSLRREPPPELVQYRDAGLFLNYAPRLIDFTTPAANGEAGLSVAGHLLYSGVAYDQTNGVVRGLSQLTIDEPKSLRRWVFGDSLASGGDPLGGTLFLGGISVARAFALNPHFVSVPTVTSSGTALTASTLEVYVNGLLVRTEPIRPGRFRVEDLAVPPGVGTTRYVVRDAFGRTQQALSPHYGSQGALADGVSDYQVAAGLVRNSFGVESWDYGRLALSARYRVGVSDRVTLGARLEAPLDAREFGASAGPALTLLTPVGQFDVSLAASEAPNAETGIAGSASYVYQTSYFTGGLSARSLSTHYFALGLGSFDDRAPFSGTAFVSVPVGRRIVLNSSYALTLSELGTTVSVGTQGALSIANDIRFDLSANRTRYADGTAPYEVFGTLSVALGSGIFAATSGHVRGAHTDASVEVSKPAPAETGIGYRAQVTRSTQTAYATSIQGQAQHGEAHAQLTGVDRELHSELGVAGSVVVVPSAGVFFARPVQDGYAVIQVPGAEDVRGYLNGNEVGSTDGSGDLLVPNLLPYYENRLSVSDEDLPSDYLIEGGDQVAAAPYRGPAVVRFEARRASFVRGVVLVRRGKKNVVPSYGEISVRLRDRLLTSPIAREGQFEFEELRAGRYRALVEYGEGSCELHLKVPASKATVSDLGTVVCRAPGKASQ